MYGALYVSPMPYMIEFVEQPSLWRLSSAAILVALSTRVVDSAVHVW